MDHRILRVIEDHGVSVPRIRRAVVRLERKTGVDKVFAVGISIGFRLLQLRKLAAVHRDVVGQCVVIGVGEERGNVGGVGLAVRLHDSVIPKAIGQLRGGVGVTFDLNADQRAIVAALQNGKVDIPSGRFDLIDVFLRKIVCGK